MSVNKIDRAVEDIAIAGFNNIELTGGTRYYEKYQDDILLLKDKYDLKCSIHNYFPPPIKPFMLNLSSLNDDIYNESIELCKNAILLSKKLGSRHYGMHAGYLIDFETNEAGKKLKKRKLIDKSRGIERFCQAYNLLRKYAGDNFQLYVENNVLSLANAKTYSGSNPLLLTCYKDYLELKEHLNFKLLLDVGHLKVSANSLGLKFSSELDKLIDFSDYLHLSDNDGIADKNYPILKDSSMMQLLNNCNLSNKIITLEIYDNLNIVNKSYELISNII